MATVTNASAVTMPGIELVTKLDPSTNRARKPRYRTATHANGNASTVVSAAASAANPIVCSVEDTSSAVPQTSTPPIHSQRPMIQAGTPSESVANPASAAK